jgi:hypothetical protein
MNKDFLKQRIQEVKIKNLQGSNKKYPTNFQMLKNLGGDVYKNIKSVSQGNPLTIPNSEIESRKSICNSCQFFDKNQDRCTKCGCNISIKAYLKASYCPIGKW